MENNIIDISYNIGELVENIFHEERIKGIENIFDNDIIIEDNNEEEGNNVGDDNIDTESVIDTIWLEEYDSLQSISTTPVIELMKFIGAYFVYINPNDYIENILFETINLEFDIDSKFSIITKEAVLKIIQSKKKVLDLKYKLVDILSFIVDIEPENIQSFNKMDLDDSKTFLKNVPIFNDIHIDKSIFVFHNINSLFFFFKETENHLRRFTLKSILKKESIDTLYNNTSKKVRIVENFREHFKGLKNNSTKKIGKNRRPVPNYPRKVGVDRNNRNNRNTWG